MYTMGDNSILKKATDAKLQTELAKIEESANLIYTDKLIKNVSNNLKNKPTMKEIKEQLKTEGYQIEQIATNGNTITAISLDKESMTLATEDTGEIKAIIEMSSGMNYYAVVSGKYYQMHYSSGYITIDRIESEVSSEGETTPLTLTVTSSNESIATAIIDSSTNVITVTAKDGGTTMLTVSSKDGSESAICTITVTLPKLADIVGEIQNKNTKIEDENGNKITVPGGFRVLPHGTKNNAINEVKYNYDETNHIPCVQDGIVIADEEDNQFVWIPVGEIKNKDGTTTTITLGRYTFNTSNGTPTLQQNALEHEQVITIEDRFQESSGNSRATDLKRFLETGLNLSGFYLARYEYCGGSRAGSTPLNVDHDIAQSTCKSMYTNHSFVESDLVNSYAWDTALTFVQLYSGEIDYSSKRMAKVGICGGQDDFVCNLSDLCTNFGEWTTEYCSVRSPLGYSPGYVVARGGTFGTDGNNGSRSAGMRSSWWWERSTE